MNKLFAVSRAPCNAAKEEVEEEEAVDVAGGGRIEDSGLHNHIHVCTGRIIA